MLSALCALGVQGVPSGRLLSYSPATRETHVVAEGFWFANGVALSPDEAFAAVVASNSARVFRVWLAGANVGSPALGMCRPTSVLKGGPLANDEINFPDLSVALRGGLTGTGHLVCA